MGSAVSLVGAVIRLQMAFKAIDLAPPVAIVVLNENERRAMELMIFDYCGGLVKDDSYRGKTTIAGIEIRVEG